jgi:cation diffusion facilitator CzcD-associated flavoprotein CzcO
MYLWDTAGLMVSGFPNMFTITGPQSPSVLTNMVSAIEHHIGTSLRIVGAHALWPAC